MMVSMQVVNPYEAGSADAERIGEASFFMESMLSDIDRSLEIATRRSLTSVTNYVVIEGEPLETAEQGFTESSVNGTIDGENLDGMENASLTEWTSRVSDVASSSGYELDTNVVNYSFDTEKFVIEASFEVSTSLHDPVTLARFNRTSSADVTVSVKEVEDSLLTLQSRGRYISQYKECGFSSPAELTHTGSQSSPGYVQGFGEVMPEDISEVEDRSEKILFVEDVDSYDSSEIQEYAGVVSADETGSDPGSLGTEYVLGTGSIDSVEQGSSILLDDEDVWDIRFREMFRDDCYVPVEGAPDFFDRLENQLTGEGEGLATLIDASDLPVELRKQDSSVGYVYFDESGDYGDINRIKGVSDDYSWFYLDDQHVEYWGIEDLVE